MAKKRTKKCCYQSRYNESYVTPAQYITELICEKNALNKYNDLPRKFWQLPEWANMYRYQIKYANRLVKEFPHKAIVKALLDPRTKKVYSLSYPGLKRIISEYTIKLRNESDEGIEIIDEDATGLGDKIAWTPIKKPKSKLEKLRDLENEIQGTG